MHNKKLNCQQVCQELGIKPEVIPGIFSLITYTRNFGIGSPISRQIASYSEKDFLLLEKVIAWWQLHSHTTMTEFDTKESQRLLIQRVSSALLNNKPLELIAVFCPSYRVGLGEIGYNATIGNHTKKVLDQIKIFIKEVHSVGIGIKGTFYFSDLLLENYNKLQQINYKSQLDLNYKSFTQAVEQIAQGQIQSKLLSELESMREEIGEAGISSCFISEDDKLFNNVTSRNRIFYIEKLGWKEKDVLERTITLYCSYARMGEILSAAHPEAIMYWTESAYERAQMYNISLKNREIPIIFPQKI